MASPTQKTWRKRDNRDAKLLKKRQKRVRRALKKKAAGNSILKATKATKK